MSLFMDLASEYANPANVSMYTIVENMFDYLGYNELEDELNNIISLEDFTSVPMLLVELATKHVDTVLGNTGIVLDTDSLSTKVNTLSMLVGLSSFSEDDARTFLGMFEDSSDFDEVISAMYETQYGEDKYNFMASISDVRADLPGAVVSTLKVIVSAAENNGDGVNVIDEAQVIKDVADKDRKVAMLKRITSIYENVQRENTVAAKVTGSESFDNQLDENIKWCYSEIFENTDINTIATNIAYVIVLSADFEGDIYGVYVKYFEHLIENNVAAISVAVENIANVILSEFKE